MLIVPVVFTIGPEDKPEALMKYASLLTGQSDGADPNAPPPTGGSADATSSRNNVRRIVRGIIEGETRVLVSTMTAEEVFTNRALFKANVTNNVQTELSKFGLIMYIPLLPTPSGNIEQLADVNFST